VRDAGGHALITGSAVRTCLGDGEATFAALLRGESGAGPLRYMDPDRLNVRRGYHIAEPGDERPFRASRWLTACVEEALGQAGVDPERERVAVIVGTGLRELRAVERSILGAAGVLDLHLLHFASAIRSALPAITDVITISNACSAGGHALALAQDLVRLGEATVVVAAGADAMTESMLAMIGRVAVGPSEALRPFDAARTGTLLGEGAAAVVVVAEGAPARPLARLLGTGLSCDAHHETAADRDGIERAMRDAFARAGRTPEEVDLVVAHGTGTPLNDALESRLLLSTFAANERGPLITAVKGAVGHTSGGAALVSLDVAIRCLAAGVVPPIAGLEHILEEGGGLRFVTGGPATAELRLAQVDAFGFGGVNAVSLVEAA
jgi:3-oxoacyl-[acyl-carrier-protein] synthase II